MKLAQVRRCAMALAEVTEQPHHEYSSFRVRGKIFVTVPPDEQHVHVFTDEASREQALALYPEFAEKRLWGGKVVGLRLSLAAADTNAVEALVRAAWQFKRPAARAGAARARR